jgi:glyoxylase-like metal-dependent hydrolase (beta-lactamase superfamily II)
VIGHKVGAEILAAEADRPWSEAYLRKQVRADSALSVSMRARSRAIRGAWEGFRVISPSVTFEDTLTLAGGVRPHHVGGRHAEDSTVVAVPDSGVLLVGDCYYPPPLHLRGQDDGPDVELIRELAETYSDYDWFVDSHDHPRSRADVRQFLGALED